MRIPALLAALAASLSFSLAACASGPAGRGPAMPTDAHPDVRQYPGDRPDLPRPDPEPQPEPGASAHPMNGMQFKVPDGWDDVTEQAPHPESVIAVFMHEGPPMGIIAVDVLRTGDVPMKDVLRRLGHDIEDAKIVLRTDVSSDGMRGSMSWTSAIDGSGSSGHAELVRFPNRPGVTVAFLGFWDSKDHDAQKPAVQKMAESVRPPK